MKFLLKAVPKGPMTGNSALYLSGFQGALGSSWGWTSQRSDATRLDKRGADRFADLSRGWKSIHHLYGYSIEVDQ